MDVQLEHRIGFGAFSDVFRDPANGLVYKLFKRRPANALANEGHGEHEPELRRAAFNAERDAHLIAMRVASLRPYVPTFHGTVVVDRVYDGEADISDRYLLDCCYVIDFVDGEPTKLAPFLVEQHEHLREVTAAFGACGITHWHDGAVFHPGDKTRTKIIDFATKDAYHEGEMALLMAE